MISEEFASVLRSGRADFNARFVRAHTRFPNLDAADFSAWLESHVDPLVRALGPQSDERTMAVVSAAYDLALELLGEKLAGPSARHGFINAGWQAVFPKLAPHIVAAPQRVLAAFSNAVHHLGTTPGARPQEWMNLVAEQSATCATPEQLLAFGKVAAWRAGLAHFRASALAIADALPGPLALHALGLNNTTTWTEVRRQLVANPWFDPATPPATPPRIAKQAGAFRGLGGLFMEPPLVASAGENFLVRGGEECWLLTADVFGATFHRATREEFDRAQQEDSLPPSIEATGSRLSIHGQHFEIPELGRFTTAAANATTLAVTGADTHAVTLLALT